MKKIKPFNEKIFTTRPVLPDLEKLKRKLEEVWGAKWLTNIGQQHHLLEARIKEVLKVPSVSLFNNGTIALIVACQSLGLSGEVITTPFTFPATPHVLLWNGIKPIFCDIDPVTMNLDVNKIESLITPQTTAILGVHIFGTPCDVVKIQEISDKYSLKVVYDAAHAFGVEINGIGIGNYGDISMLSFHATKLFHTAEGGCLTFRDPNLKKRIDYLKNFGIKNEEEVVMPGINGKMNEIQAALGIVMLDYIEEERNKRSLLMDTYRECLEDMEGISFIENEKNIKNSYQYFILRIDEKGFGKSRDYVHNELRKYNIFTRKYFYPLCSEYACYKELPSSSPNNLPIANRIVNEVLTMPFYGDLSVNDVEMICDILKSFRGQ
jgi:dTDP-4-amino-4,6-dideoxygalactose transaminase